MRINRFQGRDEKEMTRTCALAVMFVMPFTAQVKKAVPTQPASPAGAQRVFLLKYADPSTMAEVLRVFGVNVVANPELHAVMVTSAFGDVLASVDDAIKRLDVPGSIPQNVELTAYYVVGANTNVPLGGALPKDLDGLTAELSNTAAYKNYKLLDALTIRVRTGQGAETAGSAGSLSAGSPAILTSFRIRAANVSPDGASVRIDRLSAGVKLPATSGNSPSNASDLSFNADLDMKPGQRVIAGRVGLNRDQALFLVLSARLAK